MTVQFFKHIQIKHRRTQITSYSSFLICSIFPRLFSYIITYHDVISIFLSCINTEARAEKLGFKKKKIQKANSPPPLKNPGKSIQHRERCRVSASQQSPEALKRNTSPLFYPPFPLE